MDMTPNNLLTRISVDPKIQHGSPCIKGTRTPVYVVLEALSLGSTPEEIKAEYPPLADDDIKACLVFAALLAKEEEVPLQPA
ncbi:protein containing DUF433 [sediment metagenome]|uniref:Protein containing DUF433 n=1 Tax=sediment metagenome TaxID=749907 RepID=D9PL69_9ZZZZ